MKKNSYRRKSRANGGKEPPRMPSGSCRQSGGLPSTGLDSQGKAATSWPTRPNTYFFGMRVVQVHPYVAVEIDGNREGSLPHPASHQDNPGPQGQNASAILRATFRKTSPCNTNCASRKARRRSPQTKRGRFSSRSCSRISCGGSIRGRTGKPTGTSGCRLHEALSRAGLAIHVSADYCPYTPQNNGGLHEEQIPSVCRGCPVRNARD